MNTKLLTKVRDYILQHPNRFIMNSFMITSKSYRKSFTADDYSEVEFDKCGTAACIVGWTCLIHNKGDHRIDDIRAKAAKLLKIDEHQEENLFFTDSWPIKYRDQYISATSQEERAKIAAARINHFIATKGKD